MKLIFLLLTAMTITSCKNKDSRTKSEIASGLERLVQNAKPEKIPSLLVKEYKSLFCKIYDEESKCHKNIKEDSVTTEDAYLKAVNTCSPPEQAFLLIMEIGYTSGIVNNVDIPSDQQEAVADEIDKALNADEFFSKDKDPSIRDEIKHYYSNKKHDSSPSKSDNPASACDDGDFKCYYSAYKKVVNSLKESCN